MNKIRYGLENVHYAKVTKGEGGRIEYGKPVHYPGAVSLELSPETTDPVKYYADNKVYHSAPGSNQGYSGTLELTSGDAKDAFDKDIMGFVEDEHGNIIENENAKPSAFAHMWQFEGDESGMRYVAYNCTATRTALSGKTTENGAITPATESYNITALPAEDTGDVTLKCPKKSSDYDTFFSTVVLKSAVASVSSGS